MNNQIQIWCFVFVTLFNLQGAHRSQRREFILPSRFALVKHFFQLFQNFFQRFSRGNRPAHSPAALADDLFILPPLPRFVKHFFQIFSICFRAQLTLEGSFPPPSRTAYVGYHTLPPLSSTFFLFFAFFLQIALSPPFVRVRRTFLHEILSCTTTAIMIPLNLSLRYYI